MIDESVPKPFDDSSVIDERSNSEGTTLGPLRLDEESLFRLGKQGEESRGWLPVAKLVARRMLKNEFPAEFLPFLGEDGEARFDEAKADEARRFAKEESARVPREESPAVKKNL